MPENEEFEEFEGVMNKVYNFLYGNDNDPELHWIEEYYSDKFDEAKEDMAEFDEAVRGFVRYRQDPIISDREAAAFYIAYTYRFN